MQAVNVIHNCAMAIAIPWFFAEWSLIAWSLVGVCIRGLILCTHVFDSNLLLLLGWHWYTAGTCSTYLFRRVSNFVIYSGHHFTSACQQIGVPLLPEHDQHFSSSQASNSWYLSSQPLHFWLPASWNSSACGARPTLPSSKTSNSRHLQITIIWLCFPVIRRYSCSRALPAP